MSTKIRVSENSLEIKLEGEGLNLSLPPFPTVLKFCQRLWHWIAVLIKGKQGKECWVVYVFSMGV